MSAEKKLEFRIVEGSGFRVTDALTKMELSPSMSLMFSQTEEINEEPNEAA